MKRLVCLFSSISSDIYFRDMFLVPYYIGLKHNYSVSLVYHGKKGEKDSLYKGVQMIPLHYKGGYDCFSFLSEWYFCWYILKNAKNIDCLVRFHFSYQTAIIGWIYKKVNPKGFFYIKGDGYGAWLALFREKSWFKGTSKRDQKCWPVKWKNRIIRFILNKMCQLADKVSVELPEIFECLSREKAFKERPEKLKLMFNGIDERSLYAYGLREFDIVEKENVILSVGRHGSWQKNTMMFLNALSQVDLKNWKVFFIGTVETHDCLFQREIDGFFEKNPSMREQVCFIGPIYNQKKLYEYYNKAKVFVHTALYESYGIVLGEAFRFKNYIISTPVGIAPQLIKHGYGCLCECNNVNQLVKILQDVIDGNVSLEQLFQQVKILNKAFSYDNEIDKLGNFRIE